MPIFLDLTSPASPSRNLARKTSLYGCYVEDFLIMPSHRTPSHRVLRHVLFAFACLTPYGVCGDATEHASRPNILLAISDDQSFPHTSSYGSPGIYTPAFDRVAREGVLFTNAYTASPGCSPSRASILTGRYPWQNEHAGTHASKFSNKYATYPALLQRAGYQVGYTGKGWGPGNFREGGFRQNPAGRE